MKPPRWTAAEMEALEDIAGNYPPDRFSGVYNNWAAHNGYVLRSHQALLTKLSRQGLSARACGDWISSGYICEVLGVGADTPKRWSTRYGIPCHRDGRKARFYRRSDLRRVAQERPAIFGGISPSRLFMLLEDRELADRIAGSHGRRGMDPKPVRAVETGWLYPSVRAAAARVHVTRQAIQYAIRTGRTAAGYHWTHA